MEGLLLAVCIVSAIFNLVMFLFCVRVRNDCVQMFDAYIKASDKAKKTLGDVKSAMLYARGEMVQMMEELHEIINESDGDCKGKNC